MSTTSLSTTRKDDVIVDGFASLFDEPSSSPSLLQWYCAPESWPQHGEDGQEGYGGKFRVMSHDIDNKVCSLELFPPMKKDFWRKTYYRPVLVKDDGSVLYTELDDQEVYTITTSFCLDAQSQFDQAGIYIRLDHEHWIKTGIEVVDGVARLSCVVTNVYSDWSTQPWPSSTVAKTGSKSSSDAKEGIETSDDDSYTRVNCTIRVHCRGFGDFVVESRKPNETEWEFLRICHLSRAHTVQKGDTNVDTQDEKVVKNRQLVENAAQAAFQGPAPAPGRMWAGVFGCCPMNQPGDTKVQFEEFRVVRGSDFDHDAD